MYRRLGRETTCDDQGGSRLHQNAPAANGADAESTFASAVKGLEETGASAEERDLVSLLARHNEQEGALLERYRRVIDDQISPAMQFVVRLILEGERRHHRLLAETANSIAWGWTSGRPADAVPEVFDLGQDAWLSELTREVIRQEKHDRKELRKVWRRLRRLPGLNFVGCAHRDDGTRHQEAHPAPRVHRPTRPLNLPDVPLARGLTGRIGALRAAPIENKEIRR
jgi:hypothetical protein